ncbi:MAG: restriction endonuclease subunit S [Propionibacteriaceae bacterium]
MSEPWPTRYLADIANIVGRGITPKYSENGDYIVINQRCVRDGRVSLERARRHDSTKKYVHEDKRLISGDILVNSTGVGTLGRTAPIRELELKVTVDSHLTIVRPGTTVAASWLAYALSCEEPQIEAMGVGSTGQTELPRDRLALLKITVPSLPEQRAIAATLGALDDKIESNLRQRTLCRQLGQALVAKLEEGITEYAPLEDFALSISRGVTPKYYTDEDVEPIMVLNQRCIRDGWVSPNTARLMFPRLKAKDAGIAEQGDLLVNSTGQGTLGRVGRWSYEDALYVDSHVTVVKADRVQAEPTLLSYLVFPRQSEIEDMAEGSTGQTELSPDRLGSLELPVIPMVEQESIEPKLLVLEEKAHAAALETAKLEALRDTLLPELMSGRLRVAEAREAVEQEVGE